MNENTLEAIKQYYKDCPISWYLNDDEIESIYKKYKEAISTTNGDTETVEISTRQLILFIGLYTETCS